MRILLVGGKGFIGSRTLTLLKKEKYQTILFQGDVKKVADWEKSLQGGEVILFLAGLRTETKEDFRVNADGVGNLYQAIAGTKKIPKKVVLASSQAVYLGSQIPFRETQKPRPTTVYGQSKLQGEKIAQSWSKKLKIPLVILRYSTVLGSGVREESRMSGPLYPWAKAAEMGAPIKVFQDGRQSRDYVHVADVARANLLVIKKDLQGIFNVGGGKKVKLIDFAEWVREATGGKSEIVILGGKPTAADPKHLFSEITKLKKCGWRPRKTAQEAVYEFIDSYSGV